MKKYIPFQDIKSNRDFLIKRDPHGKVMVYHKECCYHGEYSKKDMLKKEVSPDLNIGKEIKKFTYEAKGMSKELSNEKVADLSKMYDKFIDPNLRPKWLPVGREIKNQI
ncbi:MAG: hypothetical protein OMM_05269 [Candidatus Magnetoglobus multicellularis str. Araruama]|uniref:Uncharacterized protein n=1 Tax=Candidatus Magnetoglobus multicellularis str. Araruama TaxID=890399 RepID=A0A1V1NXB9_9BACT|nr:MAG: hypothetical protein OMM_05269 [Candidatus Magnetoglobus multicellularis str. Araruama]